MVGAGGGGGGGRVRDGGEGGVQNPPKVRQLFLQATCLPCCWDTVQHTLITLKRVPCPIPSLSLKNEWSGNVRVISLLIIRSQGELLCNRKKTSTPVLNFQHSLNL